MLCFIQKLKDQYKTNYFYIKIELTKRFNVVIYIIYISYMHLIVELYIDLQAYLNPIWSFYLYLFLYMPYKHYRINKLIRQYSNSGV